MSLNRAEMAQTSQEMQRHLEASGLSVAEVATWLDMTPGYVASLVAMDGTASPADTWLMRDALTQAVADAGRDAGGWSVLTEGSRGMARRWFSLRRVPPRPVSSDR